MLSLSIVSRCFKCFRPKTLTPNGRPLNCSPPELLASFGAWPSHATHQPDTTDQKETLHHRSTKWTTSGSFLDMDDLSLVRPRSSSCPSSTLTSQRRRKRPLPVGDWDGIQDETPLKAPRTLKPQGPNTEYICMKDHSL